jgi:AraC family L-rhamnose operon regulatory protein RhaS
MSLVKSRELFTESAFPIAVDTLVDRTLIQKEPHRHEYFEMLYVEQGTLINHFKNESITMQAGDLLVMKPYVLHVLEDAFMQESRKAYCCSFLPQTVDLSIQSLEELKASRSPNKYFFRPFLSLAEETVSAVQFNIQPSGRSMLRGLFNHLKEASHDHSEKGHALTRCHFMNLMAFLSEQYGSESMINQSVQIELAVPVSRYQAGLRKTLNYIHDHFTEALSLDEMAAMSGASETYFCRLFKHETGMTFLNYLNSLRIEKACELLRNTCDNAADICYQVGFNDYTHFGRQFRKSTGMSPSRYRREKQAVRQIREA